MDIETVSEAFLEYLDSLDVAKIGVDLFLNRVDADAPDNCWWVITSGGSPIQKLSTGEKVKQYFISIYHRNLNGKSLERNLFRLEELLNSRGCVELTGFEVVEIEAQSFASDEDLTSEERRIGFLQANVKVYKTS